MSSQMTDLPPNGKTTLYDEKGKTQIPKDVKEAVGIEPGEEIQWVYEDGVIKAKPVGKPSGR